MKFILPDPILQCIQTLNQANYEAYVVGGAVRDLLMGKTPNDYDIATNALPDAVMGCFEKTVPTGEKHGTITVLIENYAIEVTTYRSDGQYQDNRHPTQVEFKSNIEDDLSRRDFTINAFAYHPEKGFVDLFNGQADLQNKQIATVGDAETRFFEDALRIMRAFRFAAQLDFVIEPNTLSAAQKLAPLLKNISAERIGAEFIKLLCGQTPAQISPLLKTDTLTPWGIQSTRHSLEILGQIPNSPQARLAMFCILTDSQPAKICQQLKYANKFTQETVNLHRFIADGPLTSAYSVRKAYPEMREELWEIYFEIADILWPNQDNGREDFLQIKAQGLPCKISDLSIDGNDLLDLGLSGKEVGAVLQYLLDQVLQDPKNNHKSLLLAAAKDFIKTI